MKQEGINENSIHPQEILGKRKTLYIENLGGKQITFLHFSTCLITDSFLQQKFDFVFGK